MAGNMQRVQTLTIANNALVSEVITLSSETLLSLQVPALTAGVFAVSGCASGGLQMVPILNEAGTQILSYAASTGLFTIGAKALADLTGLAQIQVGSSASQNAARVFTLRQKVEE